MRKIFLTITVVAMLLGMASCKKEEGADGLSFKATAERSKDDEKLSLGNGSMLWNSGDSIRIYDNAGNCANFVLSAGAGSASGTFDRSSGAAIGAGPYKAVYPARFYTGSSEVTLPNMQRTVDGSLRELPMYATGSGNELQFFNICGVVRFRLTASGVRVRGIVVTTNVATNGAATISGSGSSTTIGTPNGTNTTILLCETAQDITSGHDFYMYLPAGSYSSFDIKLLADDWSSCTKSARTTITVQRGKINTITLRSLTFADPGVLPGEFSVANGRTVRFSMGNLQYIGSAATPYWKFAEHQYDYLGRTTGQNSDRTDVDRDLFGWGTSGWNNGNYFYMPYNTRNSGTRDDGYGYGPTDGSSYEYDLTGDYANADWGVYNAIRNGGNAAGLWRTPTWSEWSYLLITRTASTVNGTANARFVKAKVNGINGVIFFPDSYVHPSETAQPTNINVHSANYNSNEYTVLDWLTMEAAGAVFLPATGHRIVQTMFYEGSSGYYWSSTYNAINDAHSVFFSEDYMVTVNSYNRFVGLSVRLVRD